jgi:hypothetical protein
MPALAPESVRLRHGGGAVVHRLTPQSLALASGSAVTARALNPQMLGLSTSSTRGLALRTEVLGIDAPGYMGVQAQLPLERIGLKDWALLVSPTGSEIRLTLPAQALRLGQSGRTAVQLRAEVLQIRDTGHTGLAHELPVQRLAASTRVLVGELRPIQGSVGMRSVVSRSEPCAGSASRAGAGTRVGVSFALNGWAEVGRSGVGQRSLTSGFARGFGFAARTGQGARVVQSDLPGGFGRAFRVGSGERDVRGYSERGEGRAVRDFPGAERDVRSWAERGEGQALRVGYGLRAPVSWLVAGDGGAERAPGEGQRDSLAYLAPSWAEAFRLGEGVRRVGSHAERANSLAYRHGEGSRRVTSRMEGAQGSATRIGVGFRRIVGWVQISWALAESFVYGPVQRGIITGDLDVAAPGSRLEVKRAASSLNVSAKG